MNLEEFIFKVKPDIEKELEKQVKAEPKYEKLKHQILAGKKLRPILALLTFKAFNGKDYEKILKTAVGIELAHQASLIHNDIIDKDQLRRELPSAHIVEGTPKAILTGHKLLINGMRSFFEVGFEVLGTFLDAWSSSLKGEMMDAEVLRGRLEGASTPTKKLYYTIIRNKTASLFASSAKVGGQIANVPSKIQNKLYRYGEHVGIAFQLADDYVDMKKRSKFETLPLIVLSQLEENLKKSFLELIREGKMSPLTFLERAGIDARKFYMDEIKENIDRACQIVEELPNVTPEYANLLKEAPAYYANQQLKEVGEEV